PRWPYPSAKWVQQCEREVELEPRLPGFIAGTTAPAGPDEQIALTELCAAKRLNGAAVRFFGQAFAAEPKLADDLEAGHRFHGAWPAGVAGCGQGRAADPLDRAGRARLRRQALVWLRADLEAWSRLLDKAPEQARPAARMTMRLRRWLVDPDLADVRGP